MEVIGYETFYAAYSKFVWLARTKFLPEIKVHQKILQVDQKFLSSRQIINCED